MSTILNHQLQPVSKTSLTSLTVHPHWFSEKSLFFLYISMISPAWLGSTFTPLQHTHLLKTHVIFNNRTLKTIKQYMYIILPLNFPHIYLHGLHLIKPHKNRPCTYTACISLFPTKPHIYQHGLHLIKPVLSRQMNS